MVVGITPRETPTAHVLTNVSVCYVGLMGANIVPTTGATTLGVSVSWTDGRELRAIEATGVSHIWVGGHIAAPQATPEPVTALALAAAHTEHVRVGTAVIPLPLYNPAVLSKQLAEIDRTSGGRVVVGVGVGGEFVAEFDLCGVDVHERGRLTDAGIRFMRSWWSGQHDSPALLQPAPSTSGGPPIVVAGRQPRAMRRAALLGSGWMPYFYSPRRYAASVSAIREIADEHGRDLAGFEWMAYTFVSIADTEEQARTSAAEYLAGFYQQDFTAMLDSVAVVGTPQQVAERLQGYIDAGARHIVATPCAPQSQPTAERLMGDVVPLLATAR